MDFDDTREEAEFRAEARAWLEAHTTLRQPDDAPEPGMGDEASQDLVARAKDWQGIKADSGWACITWPEEFGGRGASAIQNVIWNQEEGRYRTPPNIFTIGQGMLGPTIMAHGSPTQKERYLKKMLRGEEVWCQLFSEPSAGSDLAGLRTRAVRDGDDWIVNGQKIWTTGAHYSDYGMLLTRTDPGAPKHAGITYFIVDMSSPGIDIRPIRQINGATGFNEVFFSDVRIPDGNRVGAENDGWRGAITTLMNERAAIGGGGAGLGIKELIQLLRTTPYGDGVALDDDGIRQKLADFHARSTGLQYTGYRTLTALSRGQTPGPESSIGKLVGAPLRQEMAAFALEVLGAAGTITGGDLAMEHGAWQRMYLTMPGLRLAGGTDEILRNIIAERVLGLPAEVRVDKDKPFSEIPH